MFYFSTYHLSSLKQYYVAEERLIAQINVNVLLNNITFL